MVCAILKKKLLSLFFSTDASTTENGAAQLTSNFEAHLSVLNIARDPDRNMEDSEDTAEEVPVQNEQRRAEPDQPPIDANEAKEELQIEDGANVAKSDENEPFEAFVVMNGSATTISSKNASMKAEKVILSLEDGGEHNEGTKDRDTAIVVGQITTTLCPKPESAPSVHSGNEVSSCYFPFHSFHSLHPSIYILAPSAGLWKHIDFVQNNTD